MNRKLLGVVLIILVSGAGGYVYLRLHSAPSEYNPAFSDVELRTISLSSADCTDQGCATNIPVSIPFPRNPGSSDVPYYADLILISNPGSSSLVVNTITALKVSGDVSYVSTVDIYYFASNSDFTADGTPAGTPPGFCQTVGPLGCTVFSGEHGIPAKGGNYLEVVAYETPGAAQGSVSVSLEVQWS